MYKIIILLSLIMFILGCSYAPAAQFGSETELKAFLEKDKTNELTGLYCDEYSRILQFNANKEGYLINCQVIGNDSAIHMLNTVVIGDWLYYVEPTTDEILLKQNVHKISISSKTWTWFDYSRFPWSRVK